MIQHTLLVPDRVFDGEQWQVLIKNNKIEVAGKIDLKDNGLLKKLN